ncbi:MAG: HAD family hydrolase [Betaproteobacteria bacterium]|jgi:hydroxymethylpyrimidine pyrophosphatase-like HAD family hydrolase/energy-coupling factor transporter ATP-binding protein EcfA2|nr:HAD family hydrolase [Betaproteobacteria bacterium]MBK7744877.1 HAD family hydrolase [Betaproteobacteria bacterium]MBK9704200.1 HAD family hydrolase [Betaproteobacteria bacterium]
MRYLALVTDYDGTLASDGKVSAETASALERLRQSGRRAILVTGRRLDDLRAVCPYLHLFDYVVAENGAVVHAPFTRETTLLGARPSAGFIDRLKALGVDGIQVGEVLVATWVPHHVAILQTIREMGLEMLIVFNRDAVMALPAGINKATGLEYALRKLGLSFHEAVGIGDAENDHSFLRRCECAVAVSDAVPSTRALASLVTLRGAGGAVVELVEELIADDLAWMQGRLTQNLVAVAADIDGNAITVSPYGVNILVAGPSGSGKSTVTAGIVERLVKHAYQVCIVDPEGDYGTLQEVVTLGSPEHSIGPNEALSVLEDPTISLNVNLLGVELADRPQYFRQLWASLAALRTRTGRPHWIVLDEAHHLLPVESGQIPDALPRRLGETLLVTVHPEHLPPAILAMMDVVIAVGRAPDRTLRRFAEATGIPLRWDAGTSAGPGQIVVWFVRNPGPPMVVRSIAPTRDRIRHRRKYAAGDMRYRSFYFRGPGNRHNLKAQNLAIFSQIADGIDEDTWLYHLHRGDYSRWFRNSVNDHYLADQAERIEQRPTLSSAESRTLIRNLIDARYTLPE